DRDGDHRVAGASARTGISLTLEPDLLTLGEAGRHLHLDLLAGRQPHALLGARGGLGERDRQGGRGGAALFAREIVLLEMEATATTRPPAAAGRRTGDHGPEDVLESAEATTAGAATRTAKPVRTIGEALESALPEGTARPAASGAEAFEALETWLAFGVDFAVVEGLAL